MIFAHDELPMSGPCGILISVTCSILTMQTESSEFGRTSDLVLGAMDHTAEFEYKRPGIPSTPQQAQLSGVGLISNWYSQNKK